MRCRLALVAAALAAGPATGQPAMSEAAYAERVRQSLAAAASLAGPLEGGWRLTSAGADLYQVQLIDREDRLEGAWRDLRRPGALSASGYLGDLRREGERLTFSLRSDAGTHEVATLTLAKDSAWRGELEEGGVRRPVVLRRD